MATFSKQNIGRTKICEECQAEIKVAFRVRISKHKDWIFVCEACCIKTKKLPEYQYGGTWKGFKK